MSKLTFETPIITVTVFSKEDTVTTSDVWKPPGLELPDIEF